MIEFDLAAIVDVFATSNHFLAKERQYRIEVVSSSSEPYIQGDCGLQFSGARHYSTVKGSIDTLLIVGVHPFKVHPSPSFMDWLRSRAAEARRVASVTTGAYILALAGLLDGKRATTHWAFAKKMAARFPAVKVEPDPIWIRDGNIYSSAGGTSVIDLSLALIEEDHGQKFTLEVARFLVVFLHRPGNQAQFSVSLQEQRTEIRPLRDLQFWIREHLKEDLSTPALAARVAMSERNFQRVFTREIGKSPAKYVEEGRIEAARRKLERSTLGLQEIASACGFSSADVMNRCFQRHFHTTPIEYRERFRVNGGRQPRTAKASSASK